jgi:exopolysaccharide biosynthesis operon protein EpsL
MSTISRLHRGQLALLLAAAGTACAQHAPETPPGPLGGLHLVAGAGAFHDDNLFRIPSGQPPFDGRRGDDARYLIGGLLFDKAYGGQKLYLQGKVSRVSFQHFKQLDYHGKDFLGLLDWRLGPRFEGSLGASYADTLAPYTDIASRERNLRQHRRAHADGAWRVHPRWRVRLGAARDKYRYRIALLQVNDRREDAVEAGIDFTPPSNSTAGLLARRVEGTYPNPRNIAGVLVNDDFTQDELKAKIDWKASGISSLTVLAGYARRRHALRPQRDASGFNGRATASLNPRQKLRLNGAAWREFAAIESDLASYSLNRGTSAGASWDASARVRVEAAYSAERRRYQGAGRDRLRTAQLGLTWAPRAAWQLGAGVAQQRRSGAALPGSGSVRATTISMSASVRF